MTHEQMSTIVPTIMTQDPMSLVVSTTTDGSAAGTSRETLCAKRGEEMDRGSSLGAGLVGIGTMCASLLGVVDICFA